MNAASSERCAAGPRIACGELGTLVQAYRPASPVSVIRSSNTTRQALRTFWIDSRREASRVGALRRLSARPWRSRARDA